jgi:transcriptional regulator with XRE-family HTH domain
MLVRVNAGAALLKAGKLKGVARMRALEKLGLRVSQPAVSGWETGKKLPSQGAREKLAVAPFGIPVEAWGQDERPALPAAPASSPSSGGTTELPTASALAKGALEAIQTLQEQMATQALSVESRKRLSDMLGAAIDRYARLTGQDAPEKDLLRSPQWAALSERIASTLVRYPEAARAVEAVLSGP